MKSLCANTFWLLLPILGCNIIFRQYLPPAYRSDFYWKDIPGWISLPENLLRIAVMILPLILRFSVSTGSQQIGLVLYLGGSALYFASWWLQISRPSSVWSTSAVGFLAPAFTPIVWLAGIALTGDTLTISGQYFHPGIYLTLSAFFVLFHCLHTWQVHTRHGCANKRAHS